VPYRLVGKARAQIERIVTDSARRFGLPAAERYFSLMLATFAHLDDPAAQLASTDILALTGVRVYQLALGRASVPRDRRVRNPRHLVVYRVAPDGMIEILGVAHDRMLLSRAARRMVRSADT
jgi:toxin ParE1/3/4